MATATSTPAVNRMRTARALLLGGLAVGALLMAWNWGSIKGQARVGAAYGAHITCSCRYIEGRDMASCETDKEAGMALVRISDEPDSRRVTASVPFLAEAVAERRSTFGCVLLTEAEIEAL